ncbi:hypothetical protein [Geovibrio ferrireducens]|uniref:hypothetical protein n=1 Tax=Geovibrio ferrireducens TaxID=46201 RepID=UPI0022461317|nr:hypothetical protein [Geovibrio ferrireducens]
MSKLAKGIKDRLPVLRSRIRKLEELDSLRLKQADVVRVSGASRSVVSRYFAGLYDSDELDAVVEQLIREGRESA